MVTGAGSGIGKAAAKMLAYAGASIAVVGITEDELSATEHEINNTGGKALRIVADISDEKAMQETLAKIKQAYGKLDIVVANAGVNGVWAPLEDLSAEEWDKTMRINLRGTFLTVKCALPLLKVNGGVITIIASVNGTRMFSNTGATAYATSKAGQVAFARMMALELATHHVRVNTICPGSIQTKIDDNTERRNLEHVGTKAIYPDGEVPLTSGVPGTSGQVAELIWFLSSDAANHITGTEVFIDGAQSLVKG